MDRDVIVMHQTFEELRRALIETVEALDDADINRGYPGVSNTIGILLRHLVGSEGYWISGVTSGETVHRNRDAEFGHDPLQRADLLAALRQRREATEKVLSRIRSEDLRVVVTGLGPRGTDEVTKGYAIIHAIQHLAFHLGQVRLMAAMARHHDGAKNG